MRNARYGLIERLAERLVAATKPSCLPIPVERIAFDHGCTVRRSDLKDISGILVRAPDGNVIGVNSSHHENRRRFTIAHELGHLLLHEGERVTFDRDFRVSLRSEESSSGTDVEEIEANFFAASLLMPHSLLVADERARTIDLEDAAATAELARLYAVSTQAMTLRLARLLGRRGNLSVARNRSLL